VFEDATKGGNKKRRGTRPARWLVSGIIPPARPSKEVAMKGQGLIEYAVALALGVLIIIAVAEALSFAASAAAVLNPLVSAMH
jgi:hypothetical protein